MARPADTKRDACPVVVARTPSYDPATRPSTPGATLADESGIAPVMALAVMLVLTVLVSSAVAYTSSGSRAASRSNAGLIRREVAVA